MQRSAVMLALALISLAGLAACASSRTVGQRTTEELVEQVDDSSKMIQRAREQVQTTLANYNAIIENETENPTSAYKDLSKDIDRLLSRREDVRKRLEKMNKTAENLFAKWEQAISTIESEDLRDQATRRMETARQRFDEIVASVQKGREAFDPFVTSLNDQVTYLGFNLTPDAIAGLKDQAAQLNEDARSVFDSIDSAIAAAQEYKASVSPGEGS